jgi:hypothetical protein
MKHHSAFLPHLGDPVGARFIGGVLRQIRCFFSFRQIPTVVYIFTNTRHVDIAFGNPSATARRFANRAEYLTESCH